MKIKQFNVPYVGALYDLAGKVFFIFNAGTFILMTRSTFYNASDTLLRDVFGSYVVFLAVCFVGFISFALIVYMTVVANHNAYSQRQAVIDGRSPLYDEVVSCSEKLNRLNERIEKIELRKIN